MAEECPGAPSRRVAYEGSLDPLGLFSSFCGLALLFGRTYQPSQDEQATNHGENLQKAFHMRVGSFSRRCGRGFPGPPPPPGCPSSMKLSASENLLRV